ncbi:disease resistance protein (TIR-NBS-LRR class) [Thalictrum thalictroides]|uniref:Disease resistance protein (TIR-NBS-LRR class) n=1 Tax=Thalictrum thalictroides TaxID=46969 RepID=A0A7J6VCI9_THATH|nr:disease resistance protein (TIR-NBS-LRR class) [Thalictrum thalictroides]
MDCILYLLLFDVNIKIETLVQYWFAEGFIGTPTNTNTMDLDAIFKCGQNLLDELQHRHMVVLRDDSILGAIDDVSPKRKKFQEMLYSGNILLFPRKFKIVKSNSDVSTLDLDDIDRISIWDVDLRLPSQSPTNCTKLSTIITTWIRLYDIPEKFFENMENVRVLSLMRSHFTHLPSSIARLGKSLKLLDLHECSRLECLPLPYLGALGKLEVLDLSETPLTELPDDSFDGLQSLRLLNLSKCPNIVSLPPSLSCLLNLEHLLLEDCQSLSHLPTSIDQPLQKLQLLHLSGTKLLEIPERFFQGMLKLKILNLSLNPGLKSLPISIFNLVKLKKLNLEGCSEIQNMTHFLKHIPSSLEELNLSRCKSLQEVKLESSSFPNLRILNLGFTPVKVISLQNFSSLENLILDSNEKLQVVDLCNSKIRKFPLEDAGVLERLKRISLFGAKHLGKVNWEKISSLPQQVNLDQCGDGNIPHMIVPLSKWQRDGNESGGSLISLIDGVFFQTLTQSHPCIKNMQHFFVYVCPCAARGKYKTLLPQRKGCSYKDIYSLRKPSDPCYAFERCMVIERVERFPKGLGGVLGCAQLLSLHDEEAITRLSDFGIENFGELRECWIERCQAMKVIFDIGAKYQPVLKCLEKLHISKLKKLTNMCISSGVLKDGSFGRLMHLQLEYCPQIVNVFSSGVRLESLEVLEIKFCARLKEVFAAKKNEDRCLQRLHTLCLWELPALSTIIQNVQLVSLKNLKVRGCPNLRKLPIHNTFGGAVVVRGESEWWERLEWVDNNAKQHVRFNCSKPFKLPNHL